MIVTGWGLVAHPLKLTAQTSGKSRVKRGLGARGGLDNINGPFRLSADRDFRADHAFRNLAGLLVKAGLLFSRGNAGLCGFQGFAGKPDVAAEGEDCGDDYASHGETER